MRRELGRFAVALVLALAAVTCLTLVAAALVSRDLAVHESSRRGQIFARTVAAPLITSEVRAGDREATELFATVMHNRLRDGSVRHIRVWEPDGTLLWADQEELSGRRFPLEPSVRGLFGSHEALGAVSDVDKQDGPPSARDRDLLEVYAAAEGGDGRPVVIETYWSQTSLREARTSVLRGVLPLTIGALLLFAVPALLLARSLARRVQQAQDDNESLLRQALRASELERRRIAADLHDGVLQEVGGAVYAMDAMERVVDDDPRMARALASEARAMVHNIGSGLRTTMVDIYPTDLEVVGLQGALEALVEPLLEDGIEVACRVEPEVEQEDLDDRRLAFRVAREGVSNVRRHARARHADVEVAVVGPLLRVSVTDDGRGVPGPEPGTESPEGHFGLRLMRDTLRSIDGDLRLESPEGGGTRLEATFPRGGSDATRLQGPYEVLGERWRRAVRRGSSRGTP